MLLGERPGGVALAGGAVVVLAILWLAAPAVRAGAPGTGWALATGVTIAVYTLWDKHAVDGLDASPVVYFWATEMGVALVLAAVRGGSGGWRACGVPVHLAGGPPLRARRGAALGFAYILVLYALQLAPVSYVAPAREVERADRGGARRGRARRGRPAGGGSGAPRRSWWGSRRWRVG